MQIDMHFGATYIVARLAGFPAPDAHIIANAAQYVDDAHASGFVKFDNGALFQRISTVHNPASAQNLDSAANHLAWLPFHFVPGNCGLSAEAGRNQDYAARLLCCADSPVMEDMVTDCRSSRQEPHALYRLGITAHAFLDSFSHQRFGGFFDKHNWVEAISSADPVINQWSWNRVKFRAMRLAYHDRRMMLGHGMALTYPDLPWLKWSYRDGHGIHVDRDNPAIYLQGLCRLHHFFCLWRGKETELAPGVRAELKACIENTQDPDGQVRLDVWLQRMREGRFGFDADAPVQYEAKSWRKQALGNDRTFDNRRALQIWEVLPFVSGFRHIRPAHYPEDFMSSPWKLFHDAAKAYRFALIQKVLPKYGLCAA